MRMPRRRAGAIWLAALLGGALASCGSRTGLFGEDGVGPGSSSSGGPFVDGGGSDRDLVPDVPLIDATPRLDVDRTDCPDADATYVYVVTQQNELFSFYPPDLAFKLIGTLVCPTGGSGATPFSMAVDRRGVAYVLYDDGQLYRVSTATAACVKTSFVPGQDGFRTFGMGFASDTAGAAEKLYVTDNDMDNVLRGLGAIDTSTFALSFVGSFGTAMRRSELTGTGDGRLFAFWPDPTGASSASHLSELDKATGRIVAQTNLPFGRSDSAFAFAFWGGDFWIFTSSGGSSDVNRYRPTDGTTTTPTTHPSTIVGAGVSTCAPQL
jgi:hypothetical protein